MSPNIDLPNWFNTFPSRVTTSTTVDKKSREIEMGKCPSDYQMLQVAEAFNRAETPRQKYFTSLCVMLMCQPSRSIELNGLTIHSLQRTEKGRWYLMWHPAKGGDSIQKWIPKLLEDVVQQAFERLINISAPARAAVKFAYDYPDTFMIHDECITPKNFAKDKSLTFNQFGKAMGLRIGPARRGEIRGWRWTKSNWIDVLISELNDVSNWRKLIPENCKLGHNNEILQKVAKPGQRIKYTNTDHSIRFPSYNDLATLVYNQYKTQNFPYYGEVPLWESISLVRDCEFNKKKPVKPFSWLMINNQNILNAIGNDIEDSTSIFEDLDITDEDGSKLKLTTHKFRHWLNTKLILSGEDDWLIAKWSGRADIKQNKDYDGRTQEQKSRLTKRIGHVVKNDAVMTVRQANQMLATYTSEFPPPPIVLHNLALPLSLKSLGVSRKGVAQFSGLGYCVHNYAESPCLKSGDCATCSDHVCLKGIPNTIEELKNINKLHEEQLSFAKDNAENNVFGADRWVTSLSFKLAKLKTIISILDNPNMANVTQVRIPNELDVSPVKRALKNDQNNVLSSFYLTTLALSTLPE